MEGETGHACLACSIEAAKATQNPKCTTALTRCSRRSHINFTGVDTGEYYNHIILTKAHLSWPNVTTTFIITSLIWTVAVPNMP